MRKLYSLLENLKRDERAQDMVEYALLAGFIAVAAGALLPGIADGITGGAECDIGAIEK